MVNGGFNIDIPRAISMLEALPPRCILQTWLGHPLSSAEEDHLDFAFCSLGRQLLRGGQVALCAAVGKVLHFCYGGEDVKVHLGRLLWLCVVSHNDDACSGDM